MRTFNREQMEKNMNKRMDNRDPNDDADLEESLFNKEYEFYTKPANREYKKFRLRENEERKSKPQRGGVRD